MPAVVGEFAALNLDLRTLNLDVGLGALDQQRSRRDDPLLRQSRDDATVAAATAVLPAVGALKMLQLARPPAGRGGEQE